MVANKPDDAILKTLHVVAMVRETLNSFLLIITLGIGPMSQPVLPHYTASLRCQKSSKE